MSKVVRLRNFDWEKARELWARKYDTKQIANCLNVDESEVYNRLSFIRVPVEEANKMRLTGNVPRDVKAAMMLDDRLMMEGKGKCP